MKLFTDLFGVCG